MAKHQKKKTSTIHTPSKENKTPIQKVKQTFSHPAWKKYVFNQYILILILILIPIVVSTHYRMGSSELEITETWAWETYRNQMRSTVANQIAAQYPNLPQAQRDQFINQQLDELIEANRDQLEPQIVESAAFFKSKLQDENGNTYLLAIDPYLWLTQAENYVENGHPGDTLGEDGPNLDRRNGREPVITRFNFHPWLGAQIYKVVSVFNPNFTLQRSMFLLPVIIIALSIIPAFFLGRKIGGNLSGFLAGLLVAINTSLLSRTPAGFSDTDAYIIFFPLLVTWLFMEAITANKKGASYAWMAGSAFSYALFIHTWGSGWHIAGVLLFVAFIYFVYQFIVEKNILFKLQWKHMKQTNTVQITLLVVAFLFLISLFNLAIELLANAPELSGFFDPVIFIFTLPLSALSVKSVASSDVWPNVLTTVAELNAGSWGQIIGSVGGQLFFILGIVGVLLTLLLKTQSKGFEIRYLALLSVWFVGLSFAGVMSARFIALLAAPFAIAFGSGFGILFTKVSALSKKHLQIPIIIPQVIIIIVLAFLMAGSFSQAEQIAQREVPSMSDAWYDSLQRIQADSEDGIITSWWDFGHWFVNIAERRVTFDGGGQGRRIYWVGKSLMTTDTEENKDILRMLNCGQEVGYNRMVEIVPDSYEATNILTTITYQDREEAVQTLEEAGFSEEDISYVLEKTHCSDEELIDQYYIVSQDMIGKAAVWAHFGSWNFTRAKVYNVASNNDYEAAVAEIQTLGFTAQEADELYFQAISLTSSSQVDAWISPWPSYITSSPRGCTQSGDVISCSIRQGIGSQQGQQIILDSVAINASQPEQSQITLSVVQGNTIVASEQLIPRITSFDTGDEILTTTYTENTNFPYEVLFMEVDGNYQVLIADPLLARSMFSKLFYFDGKYSEGYEKLSDLTTFTGQRVIVYKVDLQ